MRTFNYVPRANSAGAWETGAYNCRKITNGTGFSLHAYGIAADINARTNPFGKKLITDMPFAMVTAVKGIRTKGGDPVFRWGGDYRSVKDAMHYEVIASPDEMGAGIDWDTVVAEPPDPTDPKTWPTVRRGDGGPAVVRLNALLVEAGFADVNQSTFGAKTLATVRTYQTSRKLTVDGIAGLQTWTSLLMGIQAVAASEQSPFKTEVEPVTARPTVELGAEESVVEELQRRLTDMGFDPGSIDGIFGERTRAAVVAFQNSFGLEPDGICGPLTWRAVLS
jgi:peptidoglycan hydrolase-like protein with peptidoglycan-binding domain